MANTDPKALCLALMKADGEQQVIEILRQEALWDEPRYWRLYGDDPSNYNAAGNQADISAAALVEKITNSRDAILMNQCYMSNIEPRGSGAPESVRLAVAKFFDEDPNGELAGQIREWSATRRREVAQNLAVFLTGNKPSDGYPSVSIADRGEGQTPLRIPETILSLGRKNKKDIPFVHGKWNMGGTAALLYAGERNLQLVVSK